MSALFLLLALAQPPGLPAEMTAWRRPPPLMLPDQVHRGLSSWLRHRPPSSSRWPWLSPWPPLPPALAMREEAVYRVGYGVIESIGELRLSIADEHAEGGRRLIKVGGRGQGAILGIGRSEKSVDGDFDPVALLSRRWTMARKGGDALTDVMEQAQAGLVSMTRQKPGAPVSTRQAAFAVTTLDPVGLLMRLRVAPPAAGQPLVLQLLDGQALWRITLTWAGREALPDSDMPLPAMRVDGRADPIFYDGRDASDRPRRTFSVWLSDDQARVPLRLTMPIGIADVVVQLVQATRTPRPGAPAPAPR